MNTLTLRTWVRNAAAVFSGSYGSVTRPGRAGRMQPPDRLRPGPPDRAAAATSRLPHHPPAEVPAPDAGPHSRRAHPATPGGHRLRHGHQHPPDRGPAPHPPHRGRPRSLDHRDDGSPTPHRKAKPVLQALDAACIPEVRTLAVDEIFFGGDRPWSASSPSMTAVFCQNAADRKAETWEGATGPLRSPGVRHLRRRQGDRQGGLGIGPEPAATTPRLRPWSTAWMSSTPRWRPNGFWPSALAEEPRRSGRKRRPIDLEGGPVETARPRCPRHGPGRLGTPGTSGDRLVGA